MTDQTPEVTAGTPTGDDLVGRTEFNQEAIWLPMFVVQHWNAGQMFIKDKTFTDCLIEGPAVMAVMNGTVFDSCAMGTTKDARTLLYRPVSQDKMAGVVGFSNCRFVRCRFVQVGFTGSDELVTELASIATLSEPQP